MGHKLIPDITVKSCETSLEKTYQISLRYLGYRSRSVLELRTFLLQKKIAEPVIETVIERLMDYNYLNDSEFANLFVSSRKKSNPKSIFAIRYELSKKGIHDKIIDHVLQSECDDDLAWLALCSKRRQWENLDMESLKKKALTCLKNRGFTFEVSLRAYEKLITNQNFGEIDHED